VVPLIGGRCARACSPSGIDGINSGLVLRAAIGNVGYKVMTGGGPANPAALAANGTTGRGLGALLAGLARDAASGLGQEFQPLG